MGQGVQGGTYWWQKAASMRPCLNGTLSHQGPGKGFENSVPRPKEVHGGGCQSLLGLTLPRTGPSPIKSRPISKSRLGSHKADSTVCVHEGWAGGRRFTQRIAGEPQMFGCSRALLDSWGWRALDSECPAL